MYFLKYKLLPTLIGFALTAIFCWLYTIDEGNYKHFTQRFDSDIYDLKIRGLAKRKQAPSKNMAVISIDEKSLKELGRWPWSRNTLIKLTQKLQQDGATVIAYDIIFSEKEQNPVDILKAYLASPKLQDLDDIHEKLNYDKQFSQTLSKSDSILAFVLSADHTKVGTLPPTLIDMPLTQLNTLPIFNFTGYIAPLDIFTKAVKAEGFVSYLRDDDGVTRRIPLVLRYKNNIFGSLSLQSVKRYLLFDKVGIKFFRVNATQSLIEGIQLGDSLIPTDINGRVYAPLMNLSSIPHYSAVDIINNHIDHSKIDGRIILIGFTAKGLTDQVATPINTALPGVYVHASVIQGILDKQMPLRPDWAMGAEVITAIIFGIILSVLLPWLSPIWSLVSTLVSYGIIFAADWAFWNNHYWILHISSLLILILVISIFNFLYGFLFERRLRKKFNYLFGQYVPPEHVSEIIKQSAHQQQEMEGESKDMSVLFADICNFTTLSEQLSAQQIKTLLNNYFTPISDTILKNKGTIDKYVGDMIIAFWGAPLDNKKHHETAIKTAIEMIETTKILSQQFQSNHLPPIAIGIGINSGEMNVGDMGSKQRRAYTVLGDNVNLASRLEGLTRIYHLPIIVGENTAIHVDSYTFMKVDCIYVKGKTKPVSIYTPVCQKSEVTDHIQQTIQEYETALQHYHDGHWDQAKKVFENLVRKDPENKLYQLFLDRMLHFKNNPPNYWDGNRAGIK